MPAGGVVGTSPTVSGARWMSPPYKLSAASSTGWNDSIGGRAPMPPDFGPYRTRSKSASGAMFVKLIEARVLPVGGTENVYTSRSVGVEMWPTYSVFGNKVFVSQGSKSPHVDVPPCSKDSLTVTVFDDVATAVL